MKANDVYVDLDGDPLPLSALDVEERRLVARLRRRAKTHPDWTDFDNYWTREVAGFYDARGLARSESRKTIPYQIAQDLSSRLGIEEGHIQPPGPFDDLDEMVLKKFGSLRAFCKATGIPENLLDRYLAGRNDMSLQTLVNGLERIGYRLRITPAPQAERAQPARGKRSKRAVRSA